MKILKILLLEDIPAERNRHSKWVETVIKTKRAGFEIDWTKAATLEEIERLIEDNDGKLDHHLFIADLSLGGQGSGDAHGIRAIQLARVAKKDLAVFALTSGGGDLIQRALDAGAHAFMVKDDLYLPDGSERLFGNIRKALLAVGQTDYPIEESVIEMDELHLELRSVVEEIGRGNLLTVLANLFGEVCLKVRPRILKQGASGSRVLIVECVRKSQTRARVLLKFNRYLGALETEYAKRSTFEVLPKELTVRYHDRTPTELCGGNWHALATDFLAAETSLLDFLRYPRGEMGQSPEEAISELFDRLFLKPDALGTIYREHSVKNNLSLPCTMIQDADDGLISLERKARISQSLKETLPGFWEVVTEGASCNGNRCQSIRARLVSLLEHGGLVELNRDQFAPSSSCCWNHGDLHGRNVLVDPKTLQPVLIDPAKVSECLPRGADIACLVVDLFLRGWDTEVNSHLWSPLPAWLSVWNEFLQPNGHGLPTEGECCKNEGIARACNWLNSNLDRIYGFDQAAGFPRWEFNLLLACEMLRGTSFFDLSRPKQFLAMLCAYNCLLASREALAAESIRDAARSLVKFGDDYTSDTDSPKWLTADDVNMAKNAETRE